MIGDNPNWYRANDMLYCTNMNKDELIKKLLNEKRQEIIWAWSLQNYTQEDIAYMLRGMDRSTVSRIISKKPDNWKPKWVKQD